MSTQPKRQRPVHLRHHYGGNHTKCGRGGITFKAPITDDPAQATCQNCLSVQRTLDRDRRAQELARQSLHKA